LTVAVRRLGGNFVVVAFVLRLRIAVWAAAAAGCRLHRYTGCAL
jgi:hypothetical protein